VVCVPVIDPPPPRLAAPRITQTGIVALRVPGTQDYQEFVRLRWEPPANDSLEIAEYRLLRKYPLDAPEPLLQIEPHIDEYFEPTHELGLERSSRTALVYRLYAVDELERAGDTSLPCTVSLASAALLVEPVDQDTLQANHFEWILARESSPSTYTFNLWSSDTLLWQRTYPGAFLIGEEYQRRFAESLPDSLYASLRPGRYCWGIHWKVAEDIRDPESITIGVFHVR
jgi:hypothetical protein